MANPFEDILNMLLHPYDTMMGTGPTRYLKGDQEKFFQGPNLPAVPARDPEMYNYGVELLKQKIYKQMGIDYVPQWLAQPGYYNDSQTTKDKNRAARQGAPNLPNLKYEEKQMEKNMNKVYPQQPLADENIYINHFQKAAPINYKPSTLELSAKAKDYTPDAQRIKTIESGSGAGDYTAIGPTTASGDNAYGAYGVMGKNVGPWTKQFYGKELTPQEFLKNPEAQDAVFRGKFEGEYVSKYGRVGAAKAWFAGEHGMNNPKAKDMLGTTVADYAKKFLGLKGKAVSSQGNASAGLSELANTDKGATLRALLDVMKQQDEQGTLHGFINRLRAQKVLQIFNSLA